MKLRNAAFAAAITLACTGAAHADNLAFGTSGINLHVVDLTPDDGVAAGLTVTNTWSQISTLLSRPGEGYRSYRTGVLGLQDVVAHGTIGETRVTAGVSSTLGDTGLTYEESAASSTLSTAGIRQTVVLTLKANSQLVVDGNTFAQLSGWNPGTEFEGSVTLSLYAGAGDSAPTSELIRNIDFASGTDTVESFQLLYANTTAQDATVRLLIRDSFYFSDDGVALAPVPEPSTYALLGAGMLVVGAAARRRKPAASGRTGNA